MVKCPEDGRSGSAWKPERCTGFWTQGLVNTEGKVVCSEFSPFIPMKDSQCGGLSNCGPYQWLCFLPQYAQQIGGTTDILMPGICSETQQAPVRQATNHSQNQCQQLSFRMVSFTALKNIINNKNKQTKNRVYQLSGNECYYTQGPMLFMSFNLHSKKNCPQTFMVNQCFFHTYYVLGMVTEATHDLIDPKLHPLKFLLGSMQIQDSEQLGNLPRYSAITCLSTEVHAYLFAKSHCILIFKRQKHDKFHRQRQNLYRQRSHTHTLCELFLFLLKSLLMVRLNNKKRSTSHSPAIIRVISRGERMKDGQMILSACSPVLTGHCQDPPPPAHSSECKARISCTSDESGCCSSAS